MTCAFHTGDRSAVASQTLAAGLSGGRFRIPSCRPGGGLADRAVIVRAGRDGGWESRQVAAFRSRPGLNTCKSWCLSGAVASLEGSGFLSERGSIMQAIRPKLASEIFQVPSYGYLASVHADNLPWRRATELVTWATRDRDQLRQRYNSTISPLEVALAAAMLHMGMRFECQVPIGPYDADFVVSGMVVVEVDGKEWHKYERDSRRDKFMEGQGFWIRRFAGRSVWRDPLQCAREVDRFAYHLIYGTEAA